MRRDKVENFTPYIYFVATLVSVIPQCAGESSPYNNRSRLAVESFAKTETRRATGSNRGFGGVVNYAAIQDAIRRGAVSRQGGAAVVSRP